MPSETTWQLSFESRVLSKCLDLTERKLLRTRRNFVVSSCMSRTLHQTGRWRFGICDVYALKILFGKSEGKKVFWKLEM